jgi:hypothetical protein
MREISPLAGGAATGFVAAPMWHLALALLQSTVPAERTGEFHSPRVRESSGVAVSRTHAGVLWTHNDSGDGPFIYATDRAGTDRGALRVPGALALDWEDMALGPCPHAAGDCLYLADTGDNAERRPAVMVYAVPEPAPPVGPADTLRLTGPPAVLHLRYPDGPADVEAIYVAPHDGALYLVTKGRTRGVRLYRVARSAWGDSLVTAERLQSLPIAPAQSIGRMVTGADVRPDGAVAAIRTYTELYLFDVAPDGTLRDPPRAVCVLGRLEALGEAVAFLAPGEWLLTSEASGRTRGSIHIARCP